MLKKLLFSIAITFCGILSAQVRPEVIDTLKPKLNTQRIEYFFGSSGVQVLEIDSSAFTEKRVSNLYSVHENDHKIMRCLAIVDFKAPVHSDLIDPHEEIRRGSPIGSTLERYGWSITKKPIYFSTIALSPEVMQWMEELEVNEAALHMYELDVSNSGTSENIHYCTIIEIHSPQYLTTEYLQAIYDDQYNDYNSRTDEIDSIMSRCSQLIENFPTPHQ